MAGGLEVLPKVFGGNGSPSQRLGGFAKPLWRTGRGQEALLEDKEELGVTSGEPGEVGSPSRRAGKGQEGREGSRGSGRVERAGKGREGREGSRGPSGEL